LALPLGIFLPAKKSVFSRFLFHYFHYLLLFFFKLLNFCKISLNFFFFFSCRYFEQRRILESFVIAQLCSRFGEIQNNTMELTLSFTLPLFLFSFLYIEQRNFNTSSFVKTTNFFFTFFTKNNHFFTFFIKLRN